MMVVDDSFQQPGAIPFSWEIKPGMPKNQHHHEDQKLPPVPLRPPSAIPFNWEIKSAVRRVLHHHEDEDQKRSPRPLRSPSAIPFSWEIKPGVPRILQHHENEKPSPSPVQPPSSPFIRRLSPLLKPSFSLPVLPSPPLSQKLKPTPPRPCLHSTEPRTRSSWWSPRSLSIRWRFERPILGRSEHASPGCFLLSLAKRRKSKTRVPKPGPASEPDYGLEVETMSPWSLRSRRSASPPWDSPKSSFSSSFRSTPWHTGNPEWDGFGLFGG